MSKDTKIEWCDHTFNPWIGCTKVSPGCLNCYAEARDRRHLIEKVDHWGKGAPRRRTSAANWKQPLKWQRACEDFGEDGHRPRVFCASLADWLDDEVPIEWLADLLKLIHDTPNLDWLLLTKRPENWHPHFDTLRRLSWVCNREWIDRWFNGDAPANVWIGTSVEDQKRASERIPELLKIPADVRFLSVEPMLERIPFVFMDDAADIQWVILGGESGPGARPCNVEWIREVVEDCREVGIAPFVKQLGARPVEDIQDARGHYLGFDRAGEIKDPKGGDMAEWPEDLRVREFPKIRVHSPS